MERIHIEPINIYDAEVSKTPKAGQFSSIGEALKKAPENQDAYRVFIYPGVYNERLIIERENVTLIGASRDETIIANDLVAATKDATGKSIGTFQTQTVAVHAPRFTAQSLTIRNDFDYVSNREKENSDPTKLLKDTQAVAVLLDKKSDEASFIDVSLEGYQDTFCSLAGRAYFAQSRISGTVDFIFGSGVVLFENCDIVARYSPTEGAPMGYITAPSTNKDQFYGLTFSECRLMKEDDRVTKGSYALGRPWHPTTTFVDGRYADPDAIGKATFLNCILDDHIFGWDKMHGTAIDGEKIWFYPDKHARFAEYASMAAAVIDIQQSGFRPQLSSEEAEAYSASKVLNGWLSLF